MRRGRKGKVRMANQGSRVSPEVERSRRLCQAKFSARASLPGPLPNRCLPRCGATWVNVAHEDGLVVLQAECRQGCWLGEGVWPTYRSHNDGAIASSRITSRASGQLWGRSRSSERLRRCQSFPTAPDHHPSFSTPPAPIEPLVGCHRDTVMYCMYIPCKPLPLPLPAPPPPPPHRKNSEADSASSHPRLGWSLPGGESWSPHPLPDSGTRSPHRWHSAYCASTKG